MPNCHLSDPLISIVLPCRNEAPALAFCLTKILNIVDTCRLNAEIIVVDNNSTDHSRRIIQQYPVRLIIEDVAGYGAACLAGFSAAKGTYLFLADADGSYDFQEIPVFLKELHDGYDFVIGNRFAGTIEQNAMPWLHRHLGNPFLSGMLRLFFHSGIHDAHCGMRALTKKSFIKLGLRTLGMEFASEMVIKAKKQHLKIKEIPIHYYKRRGQSKLKSFADGWRHLRFIFLYTPLLLFMIPGYLLLCCGTIFFLTAYLGHIELLEPKLRHLPLFLSAFCIIAGYQLIIFGLFAKTYAITHLGDTAIFDPFYKYITIEKAGFIGILLGIAGIVLFIPAFSSQINAEGFGSDTVKNFILALTLMTIGLQAIFSSLMLSILGIRER